MYFKHFQAVVAFFFGTFCASLSTHMPLNILDSEGFVEHLSTCPSFLGRPERVLWEVPELSIA